MVTAQECKDRHKNLWRALSVILLMLGICTSGIAWSIDTGYSSKDAAQKTEQSLQIHEAAQNGKLDRVESDVKDIRTEQKEQRAMIEDIWKRS